MSDPTPHSTDSVVLGERIITFLLDDVALHRNVEPPVDLGPIAGTPTWPKTMDSRAGWWVNNGKQVFEAAIMIFLHESLDFTHISGLSSTLFIANITKPMVIVTLLKLMDRLHAMAPFTLEGTFYVALHHLALRNDTAVLEWLGPAFGEIIRDTFLKAHELVSAGGLSTTKHANLPTPFVQLKEYYAKESGPGSSAVLFKVDTDSRK
ncbi:hypothetical protein DFH06DRAFT_1340619 [Mycena polygramma]|nr:hypothetical protein DFH06DRAFT_1340619 [Mycena polygramma]